MINLGKLIDLLDARPKEHQVYFDFCSQVPATLASYRGYYDQLAIGFRNDPVRTVASLLEELRAADGKVFVGYKGGDYTMTRRTRVWVANYGCTGSTGITRIADCEWATIIETAWEDE
jgi:hypothetical protein